MAILNDRIRKCRLDRGLTLLEVAEKLGVKEATMQRYESGQIKNIKHEVIATLSEIFHCSPAYLMGWETKDGQSSIPGAEIYEPKTAMPVLGRVAAGFPMYADENIEGYIANDFDDGEEYFALKVQGDSMNAAGIGDGDYIVVRKQSAVDNGEIAVVLVNGYDATVKRFTQEGTTVILNPQSFNPEHQAQIYNASEIPISVVGKVIEVRRRF